MDDEAEARKMFVNQDVERPPAHRPALVRRIFRTWLFIMAFFFALMLLYEVMKG